MPSAARR